MIAPTIDGADAVGGRLRSLPERLGARLTAAMQRLGDTLQDSASEKLAGAVLQRRSGRLAGAVVLDVAASGEGIDARLSVDTAAVPYAAYQEFGFHGTETVRAQLRTIRQAFGRPIAERQVPVASHSRRVDYPAHSFLRAALDEVEPRIVPEIEEAVGAAVVEA